MCKHSRSDFIIIITIHAKCWVDCLKPLEEMVGSIRHISRNLHAKQNEQACSYFEFIHPENITDFAQQQVMLTTTVCQNTNLLHTENPIHMWAKLWNNLPVKLNATKVFRREFKTYPSQNPFYSIEESEK